MSKDRIDDPIIIIIGPWSGYTDSTRLLWGSTITLLLHKVRKPQCLQAAKHQALLLTETSGSRQNNQKQGQCKAWHMPPEWEVVCGL
jgi:hypothetical protein